MDLETLCIHGDDTVYEGTGAVSVPIYQTATFAHPAVGQSTGYDYGRVQNPTREHLEKTVAVLERGTDAMAFASGMAAISLLMELFRPGDHILASDDLYGGSIRLFRSISEKNGVICELCDTGDLDALQARIRPNTRAVFIETPTNPMMQVTDIAAAAALTRAKGIYLIVDNTFLTPYFQQPLALGADIVTHSGTKYLGGHNDTLAGFLVVKDAELSERLRFLYKTAGPCLSPFDSFLITRGIKTLAVRMERQQENAQAVAGWLLEQSGVRKVYYTGLKSHPGYEISRRQAAGFGAMISFSVKSASLARRILERVRLVQYAESLGGVESLITYPMLQTHADVPEEERLRKGIDDCLLRLSVGLESAKDIIADLARAMEEEA
ncbi:MAG TPA: PLP-dependent aspartate aminotransferase family protein [Feifaniaceae bacterium]|nr:PLP-dependent aspartate aminotransferase family protein [Feifaniaceae bacterium]